MANYVAFVQLLLFMLSNNHTNEKQPLAEREGSKSKNQSQMRDADKFSHHSAGVWAHTVRVQV